MSEEDLHRIPPSARPHVADAKTAEREGRLGPARAGYERALGALRGSEHASLAGSLFRWIAWTCAKEGRAKPPSTASTSPRPPRRRRAITGDSRPS